MTQVKVVAGSRDRVLSSVLWGLTPTIGVAYWKWIAFLESGEDRPVSTPRPPCTAPVRSARRTTRRLSMTSRECPRRTPGFSVERF